MELGIRLSEQLLTFLYAMAYGMLAGTFYEVFRLFRTVVPGGAFFVVLQDLLFWLVAGFGMYSFFLVFTEGAVRGYILLGAGMGMLLYLGTLGRLFALVYRKIRPIFSRRNGREKAKKSFSFPIFQKK